MRSSAVVRSRCLADPALSIAGLALIVAGFLATFLGTTYVLGLVTEWVARALGFVVGPTEPWVLVSGVATGLVLLWWPFVRRPPEVASGIRLARDDEPGFMQWLNSIGASQGRPSFDVHLTLEPRLTVVPKQGTYEIGLAFVLGLSQAELGALVVQALHDRTGLSARVQGLLAWMRLSLARMLRDGTEYSPVHWPLKLYEAFFVLVATAMTRAHERTADVAAAHALGGEDAAAALVRGVRVARRYDAYMRADVLKVAALGFEPPLVAGWDLFGRSPQAVASDVLVAPPSHLEALRAMPATLALSSQPARGLFVDLERCVRRLLRHFGERELEPIAWDEVATRCYLPYVEDYRAAACAVLEGPMRTWTQAVREDSEAWLALEHAAIVLALTDAGWAISMAPGAPIKLQRGALSTDVGELHDAITRPIQWENLCEALGIAELELHPVQGEALARA